MTIEIVDVPWFTHWKWVDLSIVKCKRLPEGTQKNDLNHGESHPLILNTHEIMV